MALFIAVATEFLRRVGIHARDDTEIEITGFGGHLRQQQQDGNGAKRNWGEKEQRILQRFVFEELGNYCSWNMRE